MSIVTKEQLEEELIREDNKIMEGYIKGKRYNRKALQQVAELADKNNGRFNRAMIDAEETPEDLAETTNLLFTKSLDEEPIVEATDFVVAKRMEVASKNKVNISKNITAEDLKEFDEWEAEVQNFEGWEQDGSESA